MVMVNVDGGIGVSVGTEMVGVESGIAVDEMGVDTGVAGRDVEVTTLQAASKPNDRNRPVENDILLIMLSFLPYSDLLLR